jgi:hypothetical protein
MTDKNYKKLKELQKELEKLRNKFIEAVETSTEATNQDGPVALQDVPGTAMDEWRRRVTTHTATMFSDKAGPRVQETIEGIIFTLPLTATAPASVPDFKQVFLLAEYHAAASRLLDNQSKVKEFGSIGPKMLVDSFSVELYLKCLYVQDKDAAPPEVHDWEVLFEELKPGTQKAVILEYNRLIDADHIVGNYLLLREINPEAVKVRDFRRALKAARMTFDKKRYMYEVNNNTEEWFYADFLGNAIRNITMTNLEIMKLKKKGD